MVRYLSRNRRNRNPSRHEHLSAPPATLPRERRRRPRAAPAARPRRGRCRPCVTGPAAAFLVRPPSTRGAAMPRPDSAPGSSTYGHPAPLAAGSSAASLAGCTPVPGPRRRPVSAVAVDDELVWVAAVPTVELGGGAGAVSRRASSTCASSSRRTPAAAGGGALEAAFAEAELIDAAARAVAGYLEDLPDLPVRRRAFRRRGGHRLTRGGLCRRCCFNTIGRTIRLPELTCCSRKRGGRPTSLKQGMLTSPVLGSARRRRCTSSDPTGGRPRVHMTHSFTARHPSLTRALATGAVALAALLVAVWIAPRASGAAAAWMRAPSVRLQTLRVPGDGRLAVARASARDAKAPVTLDAGESFTMAGVTCEVPAGDGVALHLRTSIDGAAWGPWLEAPLEVAGEGGAATAYTDPLWTGAARFVQVAAEPVARGPAASPACASSPSTPQRTRASRRGVTGAVRRLAATVAGVSLVPPASAASSAPAIVTRTEWGADESLRSGRPRLRPRQGRLRPSHRERQPLLARRRPCTRARHLRLPHQEPALERYRLQLPRRPLRDHLRRPVRRRSPGASSAPRCTASIPAARASPSSARSSTPAPPAEAVAALERLLAWKLAVHGLDPRERPSSSAAPRRSTRRAPR